MAIFTAVFLTLLYGIAFPFSRRLEGVEQWLLGQILPSPLSPAAVVRARSFMARGGWSLLASGELWLLLLLAWTITVFQTPALAFGLLAAGFGLRFAAARVFPYPAQLGWYLAHFERRIQGEYARAIQTEDPARAEEAEDLLTRVRALMEDYGTLTVRSEVAAGSPSTPPSAP
jgi:hypothetical protein